MKLDLDLASIQEARNLTIKASHVEEELETFSQEKIDEIVKAMAEAGARDAERLARMAVEETQCGLYEDKVIKNRFCSEGLYAFIKDMKTVGIIWEDKEKRVMGIAEPLGVLAGLIPVTAPTATIFFMSLISVKARNTVIFSPHPRAVRSGSESARVMNEAAVSAGGPPGVVSCLEHVTLAGAQALMRHPSVSLILAVGGAALMKEAHSSGKPTYGVGPGNVPVYVDRSVRDLQQAVSHIMTSKTFDYGTACSSEQAVVADEPIARELKEEFRRQGAYFLSREQTRALESTVIVGGRINPEVVGQSPQTLARLAKIEVPADCRVLIAELDSVGPEHPISGEILTTILAFYTEKGWLAGCKRCIDLLKFGGLGHTLAMHCEDPEVIMQFALHKPAFRILVNTPSLWGSVGATTGLERSFMLGTGAMGGTITSDNITPLHLINVKRLAYEISPWEVRKPEVRSALDTEVEEVVHEVLRRLRLPREL